MAIEGASASASASASATIAPGGRAGRRRHHGSQRSRNLKLTILSGVVTLLIFRSTIDSSLHSSLPDISTTNYVEEANRFIAQIRSNEEDEDGNSTNLITPNHKYTLGPKITNWDGQRQMFLQQNPSFSSKNPRIMLVTGSRPTPCDSTIGDHYLLKSIKNKIDYCRIHSIEIVYNMAIFDEVMSGNWVKLPLIRKLMLSHPEMEWIWWMDSDAFFTDMFFEVPFYKYEGYNMVVHGYPNLLFDEKSWIALNAGVFLLRNCQWSLDLLDAWARMGPRGRARDEAGRILTENLKGRPAFEADDQSALIYLLISRRDEWMDRVFLENSYYLHGCWVGLVDRYEEYEHKFHPGLGDERWAFITHFVGCKVCKGYGDYTFESCLRNVERAFNFADDQMLEKYGFRHRGLSSPNVKRIRNETSRPLEHTDKFNVSQTVYI